MSGTVRWRVRLCPVHELVVGSDTYCPRFSFQDKAPCGLRLGEEFEVVLATPIDTSHTLSAAGFYIHAETLGVERQVAGRVWGRICLLMHRHQEAKEPVVATLGTIQYGDWSSVVFDRSSFIRYFEENGLGELQQQKYWSKKLEPVFLSWLDGLKAASND